MSEKLQSRRLPSDSGDAPAHQTEADEVREYMIRLAETLCQHVSGEKSYYAMLHSVSNDCPYRHVFHSWNDLSSSLRWDLKGIALRPRKPIWGRSVDSQSSSRTCFAFIPQSSLSCELYGRGRQGLHRRSRGRRWHPYELEIIVEPEIGSYQQHIPSCLEFLQILE